MRLLNGLRIQIDMAVKKKQAAPKKKAAAKKKKAGGKKPTAAVKPKNTRHKRNKNNLTDQEQAFADAILKNTEGKTATDIVMEQNTKMKRPSARVKASNWLSDERINAYMNIMRDRVEDQVEYDLVKWRKDVMELIDITLGRKETEQTTTVTDPKTGKKGESTTKTFKGVDPKNAKAALELIAKQMKILTDKVELDVGEQLREIFSKVTPTLGPPSKRGNKPDE